VVILAWCVSSVVGLLTAHTVVNAWLLRRPVPRPSTVDFRVSVLLPLRDEAHRVRPCLVALLAQREVPDLEIIVLDDGSTDRTAELVRELAGDRVRLVTGAAPPPGWLGKPHACRQLAERATGRVLVFLDADVVLAPHAVAAAVELLGSRFDLVSPYPRVLAGTAGEHLVQPLLQWSWLTLLPLRAMERSPRPSLAAAGGQFLVIDSGAYHRAGGHAAVRDRVLEDIELARAVKRGGGRIALADGSRLATCRMYTSWAQLRDGYTKSLWASLGSPAAAGAAVLTLLALYLLPPLVAVFAPLAGLAGSALAGLTGYLLGVAGRLVSGWTAGSRSWPAVLGALLHPVSIVLLGYLMARSWRRRYRGELSWKGRPVETVEKGGPR
jgi:hypothetical protein